MNPKSDISVEEWLLELQRASAHQDDGLSAEEWAERLGCSTRVARERLKRAWKLGWVKVGRRTNVRMDGRQNQTPVYLVLVTRKK